MDLIEVLLQLEFEIILFAIQLYCSAVQPWLQLIIFGVRFYVELLFLYIRFLGWTCFIILKLVSASQREELLEKRVHDWKSYVRDLDEHSSGLEKKIEYVQQDCVRTKCLLKQVVGERQRLVASLQYLELCFESAHEGSNVALTAVKDITICKEDSFIKDKTARVCISHLDASEVGLTSSTQDKLRDTFINSHKTSDIPDVQLTSYQQ